MRKNTFKQINSTYSIKTPIGKHAVIENSGPKIVFVREHVLQKSVVTSTPIPDMEINKCKYS